MKYKVVRACMFCYGDAKKAWINMNKGQIWDLMGTPSKYFKYYSLWRHGVTLEIVAEDFERIFEPCAENKED